MMWEAIVILTFAVWVAIDIWCYVTPNKKTLSRKVVEWSQRWPLLPFILGLFIGILAGHFWPISIEQ